MHVNNNIDARVQKDIDELRRMAGGIVNAQKPNAGGDAIRNKLMASLVDKMPAEKRQLVQLLMGGGPVDAQQLVAAGLDPDVAKLASQFAAQKSQPPPPPTMTIDLSEIRDALIQSDSRSVTAITEVQRIGAELVELKTLHARVLQVLATSMELQRELLSRLKSLPDDVAGLLAAPDNDDNETETPQTDNGHSEE